MVSDNYIVYHSKTFSVFFCSLIICGILFALVNQTTGNKFMRDMFSALAIIGGICMVLLISYLSMVVGNFKNHIGNNEDLK
jgi:hypothetical protein